MTATLGVSYARAAERPAALPHRERAEGIDPLEAVEVPTPAVAMLGELARQQAGQHRLDGWALFRVTDQQHEVIRARFHEVNKDLGRRVSASCSARTSTIRNGRWCRSTPVSRVWTPAGCSTASSAAGRDPASSGSLASFQAT